MHLSRQSTRPILSIKLILISAFVLYLAFSPMVYNFRLNPYNYISNPLTNMDDGSFHYNSYYLALTNLLEKELSGIFEIVQVINRSHKTFQRFLYGGFNALPLILFSMEMSVYAFLTSYRRSNNTSVIALSIGGHAPPVTYIKFCVS